MCRRCLPSPLVAQLGSTFQTWSLAILSRSRAWATSLGRMAERRFKLASAILSYVKQKSKHTTVNILLVGKDEEDDIAHFAVLDDTAEFGFGFFHAGPVAGVDYEDESVSACWLALLACGSEFLTFGSQRRLDQLMRFKLALSNRRYNTSNIPEK